jgi:phage protein D
MAPPRIPPKGVPGGVPERVPLVPKAPPTPAAPSLRQKAPPWRKALRSDRPAATRELAAALFAARPAVAVAGQAREDLGAGLLALRIESRVEGMARCEATFAAWGDQGLRWHDRSVLDFGKALRITLGEGVLFDGRISGLEAGFPADGQPTVTALAEDRLQDLRMTRRNRAFEDVSDADVVQRIAAEHGLQSDVDLPGPSYRVLVQADRSDLAFLYDRARACGGEIWVEGTTLKARRRPRRATAPLRLRLYQGLRSFTVLADLAGQRTTLAATGWDERDGSQLRRDVDDGVLRSEVGGDESGASILNSAFGSREERLAEAGPTGDEVRARAEAEYLWAARRFVTGRGSADTDARLRVGAVVSLDGIGPLFSGKYTVVEVVHLFDGASGLRSELVVERPGIGRP